jgi:hypothetical protein
MNGFLISVKKRYISKLVMVRVADEREQKKIEVAQEREQNYAREVRDFIRTGDPMILKRIVFRNFIKSPTPAKFKDAKAMAVMMVMAADQSINMNLNFSSE